VATSLRKLLKLEKLDQVFYVFHSLPVILMPVPETATTSHYSNGVGPGLLQSPLFTRAIAFHELDTLGARASGPHVFTFHRSI
jgi:hypothetical protein